MKVKIIRNPSSGRMGFEDEFEDLCRLLLNKSYYLHLFKTKKKNDAYDEAIKAVKEEYDVIIVSGGDGTVNEVAKALCELKTKIPMAIFKSGTINDFANHLKLPTSSKAFVEMIEKNKIISVDVGTLNGDVFVNIAAAGIFTAVAHQTKKEIKAILGRSAYYFEAIMDLSKSLTKFYRLRIESEEFTNEGDYHLFLITNSSSVGGFDKISPIAEIQDGYLDCMFIKKAPLVNQAELFMKIMVGKHLKDKYIDYFRTKHVKIELLEEKHLDVDIDGEYGGGFPIDIKVIHLGLNVVVND